MRRLKRELWPHSIKLNLLNSHTEVEEWLDKNLGCFKTRWNVIYTNRFIEYYFKKDQDLTMFMLRWG